MQTWSLEWHCCFFPQSRESTLFSSLTSIFKFRLQTAFQINLLPFSKAFIRRYKEIDKRQPYGDGPSHIPAVASLDPNDPMFWLYVNNSKRYDLLPDIPVAQQLFDFFTCLSIQVFLIRPELLTWRQIFLQTVCVRNKLPNCIDFRGGCQTDPRFNIPQSVLLLLLVPW